MRKTQYRYILLDTVVEGSSQWSLSWRPHLLGHSQNRHVQQQKREKWKFIGRHQGQTSSSVVPLASSALKHFYLMSSCSFQQLNWSLRLFSSQVKKLVFKIRSKKPLFVERLIVALKGIFLLHRNWIAYERQLWPLASWTSWKVWQTCWSGSALCFLIQLTPTRPFSSPMLLSSSKWQVLERRNMLPMIITLLHSRQTFPAAPLKECKVSILGTSIDEDSRGSTLLALLTF